METREQQQHKPVRNVAPVPILAAVFTVLSILSLALGFTTDPDVKPFVPLVWIGFGSIGSVLGFIGWRDRHGRRVTLAATAAIVSGTWTLLWIVVMIRYMIING
jgi:hypothetical protein